MNKTKSKCINDNINDSLELKLEVLPLRKQHQYSESLDLNSIYQ